MKKVLIFLTLMALTTMAGAACFDGYDFAACNYSPKLTQQFNEDGGTPMHVYICVKE